MLFRSAISSFLAQVMLVLVKCVWLAEGHSTCRVGNFDMSKIPRAEPKFEPQDRGVLDMSSRAIGHVERDLGKTLFNHFLF